MTLANWQGSYNGLTFGGPSDYVQVKTVQGWLSLPDVSSGDQKRPRADGMLMGLDLLGGRTIGLNLEIVPAPGLTLTDSIDVVGSAFQIMRDAEMPLELSLPGVYGDKLSYCRTRKRAVDIDVEYSAGLATMAVQLSASDPLLYSATLHSLSTPLRTPNSGMTFPATFPLTFGGSTGSGGTITPSNAGNFESFGRAVITGPCISPRVQNSNTNEVLSLDITLASGDSLEIDFDAHTVILNGNGYRYSSVIQNDWWGLAAVSTTTVAFYSSDPSPTGSTMTFYWRDSWL